MLKGTLPVSAQSGEATARSSDEAREPMYHVRWKKATLNINNEGVFAGTMEEVDGELFEKGKVANTFTAKRAAASRETSMLTLTEGVTFNATFVLDGKTQKATLRCDKAEWHAKEDVIKAFGNIRVDGTFGTLTGLNEVWATPKLEIISTPALFKKP